jgi:hypothetical protein
MSACTIRPHSILCLTLALACGCSRNDGGGVDEGEAADASGAASTGDSEGGGSSDAPGDDGSGGLELPDEDSGGAESDGGESGEAADGCAAVDVLFVIDNTETMIEEQDKLRAAAGPFVAEIALQTFGIPIPPAPVPDIHVGVVTTDGHELVTANEIDCAFASGTGWMSMSASLATELDCAAAVGTAGDPDERPAQTLLAALAPEVVGIGGANQGFLREEALLVVVIVTDEEDDHEALTQWGSEGDPAQWAEQLAAVKGGALQDVVVIAVAGVPKPNACPVYQWNGSDGAEIAPRISALAQSFPVHAVEDACAAEYTESLLGQVPSIVHACHGYVMP